MGLQYYFHEFPDIIAHRGLSQWAPENTLASFRLAANNGITWAEADVRLSRDQVPMVFHDASLQRIVGINDDFSAYDAKRLMSFNAGCWFSENFANQCIPTLNQLLDLAVEQNLGLNLEIKPNVNEAKQTALAIHHLLQLRAANPSILFSSYSIEALEVCLDLRPRTPRAIIVDDFELYSADDLILLAEGLGCTSMHIHHSLLYSSIVSKSYYAPFDLLCFTVNQESIATACWNAGCKSIFSDNALLKSLKSNVSYPT